MDANTTDNSGKDSQRPQEGTPNSLLPCKEFFVIFLGSLTAEQNWTHSKLSYVLNEIRSRGQNTKVKLEIRASVVKGIDAQTKDVLFAHHLKSMSRFAQTAHDRCLFTYLTKPNHQDTSSTSQTCYLFLADNENTVQQVFTAMQESTREMQLLSFGQQQQQQLTPHLQLTQDGRSTQHFEVMYVGKIKVSHCKAPPTFIDEALEKFRQHELEKIRIRAAQNRQRHGSGTGPMLTITRPHSFGKSFSVKENELRKQVNALLAGGDDSAEELNNHSDCSSVESLVPGGSYGNLSDIWNSNRVNGDALGPVQRARSNSGDAMKLKGLSGSANDIASLARRPRSETVGGGGNSEQNRTMLFQIGINDLSLISLDNKLVILHIYFRDISHCSQGIKHMDHYGFICRDAKNTDCYVGYVFKCQSTTVTDEIMGALKQAFTTAAQGNRRAQSPARKGQYCDTCPLLSFSRLYSEIDGLGTNKTRTILYKYVEGLSDSEKEEIKAKLEGAEVVNVESENEILVMLLRALCETKQTKHIHVGELVYRADVIDQVFVSDKKHNTSVFEDLKKKAKRSFTSSFENILKVQRRPRDDSRESQRERSRTLDCECSNQVSDSNSFSDPISRPKPNKGNFYDVPDSGNSGEMVSKIRPRSSTIGATSEYRKDRELRVKHSPMMNIFMKVGNQSKTPPPTEDNSPVLVRKLSWRQTIFHRIVSPQTPINGIAETISKSSAHDSCLENLSEGEPRSSECLRALWKKAIMEQILLIRMEKENRKLKASQDASISKRIKLDYEEITPCLKDVTKVWEDMLATVGRPEVILERQKIEDAVKAGVPRHKRGEIWQLLAEQQQLKKGTPACKDVNLALSYDELLRQLTSHQHAILIDLGRTFPHHPYFSLQLGPGQLSLYNLLKAYSLLDKEVGYCQGLSFLAGVLLLHMEENCAFEMLKHLLFHQGIRFQYKPDMVALQIQMYQLSRLIHDTYPDLYQHFENQEIAPTLYAAPWFLTMFASQFPLGFVARVFDLLFLDGMEVVFKVALVLLGNHKELIMQCTTFESVMEFLKTTLPSLGIIQMERVFNQVFTMDICRQLNAYEVEYHVLQEEMFTTPMRSSSTDSDTVQRLETTNLTLKRENSKLQEQLNEAHATIHNLESLMDTYQTNINHLETRVKELELDRLNLKKSVESLRHRLPEIDCCLQSEPELLIYGADGTSRSPLSHRRFQKSTVSHDDAVDSEVANLTGNLLMSNGSAKILRGRHMSGDSTSSVLSLSNSPIFE